MTQGLEVEVVKTCEPDLLLDVDPLLEGRRRLEERVEETEARELERATVVAAQHSWDSIFDPKLLASRPLSNSPTMNLKRTGSPNLSLNIEIASATILCPAGREHMRVRICKRRLDH